MAGAFLGGLINSFQPKDLIVYEPNTEAAQKLQREFGCVLASTNVEAIQGGASIPGQTEKTGPADVVVFAVKPQILRTVAQSAAESVANVNPLVVSIAAGIRTLDLERWLSTGKPIAIVRAMPNTPALLGEGASGMFANQNVSESQKQLAFNVMQAVSKTLIWVKDEALIDVVTGVSGSGPAYYFLFIKAMEDAAVKLGLDRESARNLAAQTAVGAGRMVLEQCDANTDPDELRRRVTSPQGTTEAGVRALEKNGFSNVVAHCVNAASARGKELGDIFGQDPKL
jgi:pyrroline-5-carboxylate reductase